MYQTLFISGIAAYLFFNDTVLQYVYT